MSEMNECKTCRNLAEQVNRSQARRDHRRTRQLYAQWNRHLVEAHVSVSTEDDSLHLVRQLWPGATVAR